MFQLFDSTHNIQQNSIRFIRIFICLRSNSTLFQLHQWTFNNDQILFHWDHFLSKSNNAKLVTKKDGTKTS